MTQTDETWQPDTGNQPDADNQPDETWLRDKDLAARYKCTRQAVWGWVRDGSFPPPVKISERLRRWRLSTIREHEAAREAA